MLEPVKAIRRPKTKDEHHLGYVRGHTVKIGAIAGRHDRCVGVLSQSCSVTAKLALAFMELGFDMEWEVGVDFVIRTVAIIQLVCVSQDIHSALATSVAIAVGAVRARWVALVPCDMESVHVCLHNVEFWAPEATSVVRIAILEWVIKVVHSWHEHAVKS